LEVRWREWVEEGGCYPEYFMLNEWTVILYAVILDDLLTLYAWWCEVHQRITNEGASCGPWEFSRARECHKDYVKVERASIDWHAPQVPSRHNSNGQE
jgi:hypothetical protein